MTLDQVRLELGVELETITMSDVHELAKVKRFEVFDSVCRRFNLSPFQLSRKDPPELAQMVRAVIGDKPLPDLTPHVAAYLTHKSP